VRQRRVLDAKLGKDIFCILCGKNRDIVDGHEESTNIFMLGGTKITAESDRDGKGLNVGDIDSIGCSVRAKAEAKKRVSTFDANRFVVFPGKR
jgi:hypothetical protein